MNIWPYSGIGGSGATIFGLPVFGTKRGRWSPVMVLHRAFKRVDDAKWWILHRLHPHHRYHAVPTGLRPGYHDVDERMLHGCMMLLCEFVDWHQGADALDEFTNDLRESPDPFGPEGAQKGQINTQEEAAAIYRWWKVERPANIRRHSEMLHRIYDHRRLFGEREGPDKRESGDTLDSLWDLERANSRADQEMLQRLVAIRPGLWT